MGKQKLKTVVAGSFVRSVLWSGAFPRDNPKARAEKAKFSSAARQAINDRTSWEKLKSTLQANFSETDLVVTLTYDDDHLPPNSMGARKNLKAFFANLRKHRKARGEDVLYVYNIEMLHGDGRIHHHVVLNGTGNDFEAIRSLWAYGNDIEFSIIDEWGFEELAKYLTKEAREKGRMAVGDRSWVGSKNLKKPEVSPTEWVNGDVELKPPINAYVIKSHTIQNEWGKFQYLEYRLPDPPKAKRARPKKLKTATAVSGLEHCILSRRKE